MPDLSRYSVGCSIHVVVPQGSHWNTVADLPFAARGGICANWRIGTAHFSQCGGAGAAPNMPQATAGRPSNLLNIAHSPGWPLLDRSSLFERLKIKADVGDSRLPSVMSI
jgi:hypothetical protein